MKDREVYNKVVFNNCFGGFGLSEKGSIMLNELTGSEEGSKLYVNPKFGHTDISRTDPRLIQVVEKLGRQASDGFAELTIRTIKGIQYRIDDYDGKETVMTPYDYTYEIIDTPENREVYPEYFL